MVIISVTAATCNIHFLSVQRIIALLPLNDVQLYALYLKTILRKDSLGQSDSYIFLF